jgi:hypothetical protein
MQYPSVDQIVSKAFEAVSTLTSTISFLKSQCEAAATERELMRSALKKYESKKPAESK